MLLQTVQASFIRLKVPRLHVVLTQGVRYQLGAFLRDIEVPFRRLHSITAKIADEEVALVVESSSVGYDSRVLVVKVQFEFPVDL